MTSIHLEGITKRYTISTESGRITLRNQIFKKWLGLGLSDDSLRYREALSNVTLSVMKGESIGFIGRNGAGKSTLLKIIAGTLACEFGTISISGKVGGLIELGAGLSANRTGRENAYERARLLGMKERDLEGLLSEIEDFSDLGGQFDENVGTYSSGMKARLGFAISVTLPFDIMICDEALSVGDAQFSAKCLAKINQLKKDRIFLFVSHSMSMVQRFCERAIVLDKGNMVFSGEASDAVAFYENTILHLSDASLEQITDFDQTPYRTAAPESSRSFLQPLLINPEKVADWSAEIELSEGLEIFWSLDLTSGIDRDQPHRLGFPVFSSDGTMLFGCANENLLENCSTAQTSIEGKLTIRNHGLHPGVYYIVIALYEGMEPILRQLVKELIIPSDGLPYFGIYNVERTWTVLSLTGQPSRVLQESGSES